jgi:hypothetical protein
MILVARAPDVEAQQGWGIPFYSPADTILYLQYPDPLSDRLLSYRIRDGGSQLESMPDGVPGVVTTSDRIPGHIFAGFSHMFESEDYGETWTPIDGPTARYWEDGRPGEHSGESFLYHERGGVWLYFTSDSWQSWDSMQIDPSPDSIDFRSLSYQNGLVYGETQQSPYRVCVSSDTGRTWTVGYSGPIQPPAPGLWYQVGAVDELWYLDVFHSDTFEYAIAYVLTDTGGTVTTIDTLEVQPAPLTEFWQIIPTDQPGETYVLFEIFTAYWVDAVLFHIENFGARTDSFHYFFDFWDAVEPSHSPMPMTISLSAYPNPFNASVCFVLEAPAQRLRYLSIFDVLGRRVWEWQGYADEIIWRGTNSSGVCLSTGKYWVTMSYGTQQKTVPVILLR